jgi:glyoxylase-like metal-dependent hydrolase (beta-lactamase superfamily II)/8-oxo-dGTP pyrophosphatase MutT (NUDIX family)
MNPSTLPDAPLPAPLPPVPVAPALPIQAAGSALNPVLPAPAVAGAAPAQPRPAATTIVLRDHEAGRLEVLMLLRTATASFMPSTHVFPGGTLDRADAAQLAAADEPADALAARLLLGELPVGLAVAALRECFEECGVWLGAPAAATPEATAAAAEQLRAARTRLRAGTADIATLARELGLPLATSALHSWSHWVTPLGLPKRFDTRFFVVAMPPGQTPVVDAEETTALAWWHPAEALQRHHAGEFDLAFATRRTLEELSEHADVAQVLAAAARIRAIEPRHPRVSRTHAGQRQVLLPEHPAYAEICRLDPLGHGCALSSLAAEAPVEIAPGVLRLTAPNPGRMTGPGTNTYLLDTGDGGVVVLDPGPALPAHADAIRAACAGRALRAVLVTHTHIDHSPGAALLDAGVPHIGLPPPAHGRQDASFAPGLQPADGQDFSWGMLVLQAVHTPGHASNHVCWWLAREALLFTGDHLMQGSTVVIDPPDGDMAVYLDQLRSLPARLPGLAWLAPGHGFLMDRPAERIERLLAHRVAREAKVLRALADAGAEIGPAPATLDALLPRVYADVPAGLHPVAARSLLAHLLKLEGEGRVRRDAAAAAAQRWQLVDSPAGLPVVPTLRR